MEAEQTVEREISSLQPGEHICCFSRRAQSYLDVQLGYLSVGLDLGQKLLYLYHKSRPQDLLDAFEAAGLPARAAHIGGQLVLAPVSEIFQSDPALDPQDTLRRLQAVALQALSEGYPALRVAVEMDWAASLPLARGSADEQLFRLEALFNLPGSLPDVLLLCLYDRSMDPSFLPGVLSVHPLLLEGGGVYSNPRCLPSEVFQAAQHTSDLVELHLRAVTSTLQPQRSQDAEDALASVHAVLRERENRYRTIFDAATEAIFIHDLQGCLLEVNRVTCERLGYSAPDLLGRNADFMVVPELAGQSALRLSLLRKYGVITYETVLLSKNGEMIPVEINASLIDYTGQQVVLSFARDITDRKRAELSIINVNQALASANEALEFSNQALEASNAALRESEQKFRSLVESSPNGIALLDETGHILEFNPANEKIYGIPAAQALGKHVVTFVMETLPPEQRQEVPLDFLSQEIETALTSGQAGWLSKIHDREIHSFSGRRRYVQSIGFPICTERGYMIGMITRDVTAHRLAELELEGYRQRLEGMVAERTEQLRHEIREREQVEQNLEVMLREIHHRVKNNLNVMIALIDMQKSAHSDPRVIETFRELQTRAYSMALVHESLYRSPNLAEVNFSSYLQRLVEFLQSAYGSTETASAVRLQVDGQNAALPIETAIPCGMIVNELVTNALKYAFPNHAAGAGSQEWLVTVRMERGPAETDPYILSVADNGVGLPPDLDWQTAPTLGLQLARVLARQVGGQLELQSGPGTCWRLEFMERR